MVLAMLQMQLTSPSGAASLRINPSIFRRSWKTFERGGSRELRRILRCRLPDLYCSWVGGPNRSCDVLRKKV
jgi:hypothetical protein